MILVIACLKKNILCTIDMTEKLETFKYKNLFYTRYTKIFHSTNQIVTVNVFSFCCCFEYCFRLINIYALGRTANADAKCN